MGKKKYYFLLIFVIDFILVFRFSDLSKHIDRYGYSFFFGTQTDWNGCTELKMVTLHQIKRHYYRLFSYALQLYKNKTLEKPDRENGLKVIEINKWFVV